MQRKNSLEQYCKKIALNSWKEVTDCYKNLFCKEEEVWIFRGQSRKKYKNSYLSHMLERKIIDFDLKFSNANKIERGLLRKFMGNLHQYESSIPDKKDILEWWALMRHYGAPTRLVDWTYSFFIAACFAIENAGKDDKDSGKDNKEDSYPAIWAIKERGLLDTAEKKLEIGDDKPVDNPQEFNRIFFSENSDIPLLVYPVNPLRLSTRHSVQQGLFMCPTDVKYSFEENFIGSIKKKDEEIHLLIINPSIRKEALYDLYRMNITRASLFPGLQGFAESLNTQVYHPWILHTQHSFDMRTRHEDPLEKIEDRLKVIEKQVTGLSKKKK